MSKKTADDDMTKEVHPSFGMLSICRASASENTPLFGSSIPHRSFIQIEVSQAILNRGLNRDWIHSIGIPIVSLEMSMTQFADAITSLNREGTPCTITFVEGHKVQTTPFKNKRLQFDSEFGEKMNHIKTSTNEYYTNIQTILSKDSIGKHDKQEILKQLRLLQQQIASNLPFIKEQFTEQMDRTVLEAKNEIDAFMENKIKSLGLEGFKKELKALTFVDK